MHVDFSLKPSIETIRPSMPYATAPQDDNMQIYSYFILQRVFKIWNLCGSVGEQTVSHFTYYKQYSLLITCNMKIESFIVIVKDHAFCQIILLQ
jgi:hypothetical protein